MTPPACCVRLALVSLALLAACGSSTLTSPLPAEAPTLTRSGALALYPHTYGRVLPWHVETAEASWQHVAPCVGVELDSVRAFPVFLVRPPLNCPGLGETAGCTILDARPRIEIIAVSWDFDPAHPETSSGTAEIARLWRHELVHVALWKRDGDGDGDHTRPEWSCQYEGPQ